MKERLLGKSRASQRGLKEEKYNDRRKRYHKKMRKHGGKTGLQVLEEKKLSEKIA